MSTGGLGLNAALAMGAKSLNNQQVGIEVTGRNISNVNTAGASRQRVDYSSDISINYGYGQQGTGSYVAGIQGLRDKVVDASVVRETSLGSYYDTLKDQSTLAQSALGESLSNTAASGTTSTSGIQLAMNQFFDSWQALSTSPTSQANRQAVLSAGQNLALDLNNASQRLQSQSSDVANDATAVTTKINTLSKSIADLNSQIARAEAGGTTANDLRDQRQQALESLGELVNVTVDDTAYSNGMVVVSLASTSSPTVTLVDGTSSGSTATTASLGTSYTAGNNPPLSITYTTGATPSTSTIANSQAVTFTGQLGADIQMANVVIGCQSNATGGGSGILGQLDQVAASLVSAINTAHNAGYTNQTPPTTGIDFFNAANTRAANISISSSIDPNQGGDLNNIAASNSSGALDGSNATALANLRTNSAMLPAYQAIVANVGQQVQQASQQSTSEGVVLKAVKAQQNSVSGISLDEETTNLQTYQRAYQASARFISVIDSMLNTVINSMGV